MGLSLKWNDFPDITSSAFGGLRNDKDFSDVTLASEDGQQVEAHKVILAASSPFFQTLLRRNKHPHPLIYMRGVKSEDLVAILDFLYYGEADVYEENIESFLAIAEELNLKGLTGNGDMNEKEEEAILEPEVKRSNIKPRKKVPKFESISNEETVKDHYRSPEETILHYSTDSIDSTDSTVAVKNHTVTKVNITDIKALDDLVKSMMTKSKNMLPNGTQMADICNVCGKESTGSHIKFHIERQHLEGVSIPCNYCEKTFKSRNALKYHNTNKHSQNAEDQ